MRLYNSKSRHDLDDLEDDGYIFVNRVSNLVQDDVRYFYETRRDYPCYTRYRETDKSLTERSGYDFNPRANLDESDEIYKYFGVGVSITKYKELKEVLSKELLDAILFNIDSPNDLNISKDTVDEKVKSILNKLM